MRTIKLDAEPSSIDPWTQPRTERMLKTAEVARLLGVSAQAIRTWADAGKIGCYRTLGGHRLFPQSEVLKVLAMIRNQTGFPNPPAEDR